MFSKTILEPTVFEKDQVYEVDETQTFIVSTHPSNQVYVTYTINRHTRKVSDFGKRSQEVIGKVISRLLLVNPLRIYTDGLNIYPGLIPKSIHRCFQYHTNIIERMNLTISNSLKRLFRKTGVSVKAKKCLRLI